MDPASRNQDPQNDKKGQENQDDTVQAIIDSGNRHFNEALSLAHAGRLDEALAQVQAAISIVGNQPEYYNLLGTIQAQKGLYSEAIDAWQRCLSLDPEMEKAARSIERARLMEEEAVEEATKRPYVMWATGGVVVGVLSLVVVVFLGYKAWSYHSTAVTLSGKVEQLRDANMEMKGQLDVFKTLPPDQYFQIQKRKEETETQVAELRQQIERLNQQHANKLAATQQEIGSIKADLETKTQEYLKLVEDYNEAVLLKGDLAAAQSKLEIANGKIADLQRQLSETNAEMQKARDQLAQVRAQIAQTEQQGEQAVMQEQQRKIAQMEELQKKLAERDQEVLSLRRHLDNMRAANSKTLLALEALEENEFEKAENELERALEFVSGEPLATALHKKVTAILNDPVEQARLREEAERREEERAERVQRYISQYRAKGEEQLSKGLYEEAAESFRRALELAGKEQTREEIEGLLSRAEEGKARLVLLLDEAHEAMEQGDLAAAQRALKNVLDEQPGHPKARRLLDEMAL